MSLSYFYVVVCVDNIRYDLFPLMCILVVAVLFPLFLFIVVKHHCLHTLRGICLHTLRGICVRLVLSGLIFRGSGRFVIFAPFLHCICLFALLFVCFISLLLFLHVYFISSVLLLPVLSICSVLISLVVINR